MKIVDEAAALARGFYGKVDELEVIRKGDATPLTEADTGLHLLLRKRLDALSLDLPILSEESEVPI